MARTGAVTLIQRFGSALNPNIHFHMLFPGGVYVDTCFGAAWSVGCRHRVAPNLPIPLTPSRIDLRTKVLGVIDFGLACLFGRLMPVLFGVEI